MLAKRASPVATPPTSKANNDTSTLHTPQNALNAMFTKRASPSPSSSAVKSTLEAKNAALSAVLASRGGTPSPLGAVSAGAPSPIVSGKPALKDDPK